MAAKIEIVVGVNNTQANAALKKTQQELVSTGKAVQGLDQKLAGSNTSQAFTSMADSAASFGVSIPTAGVALFTLALAKGAESIYQYATSVSKAAQANIDLKRNLEDSKASVAGTVASLQALVNIAQDVNRSDAERSQAIGKLNSDYKGFNNTLTLANINTSDSINLINRQTNAIIRNAQIKGLENLISKEAEKRAIALTQKIGENLTMLQKARAFALSFGGGPVVGGVSDAITTSLENTNETLAESEQRTSAFTKVLNQLLSEGAEAGDLFTEKFKKVKDVVKKTKDEADGLRKVFQTIGTIRFEGNPNFDEFLKNVKPDSKVFNKVTIPIKPEISLPDLEKSIEKIEADITPLMEQMGANIGTSLGESIGNAISGSGGFENAFQGIIMVLASGLKEVGKLLIQTGVKMAIAKAALDKIRINPYLAIAAGIALVALGTAAQNSFNKKKGFARGGLVPGVGNTDSVDAAIMPGEFVLRKSAVQAIGPTSLSLMNAGVMPAGNISAGSQRVEIVGEGSISGETIYIAYKRYEQRRGRTT